MFFFRVTLQATILDQTDANLGRTETVKDGELTWHRLKRLDIPPLLLLWIEYPLTFLVYSSINISLNFLTDRVSFTMYSQTIYLDVFFFLMFFHGFPGPLIYEGSSDHFLPTKKVSRDVKKKIITICTLKKHRNVVYGSTTPVYRFGTG